MFPDAGAAMLDTGGGPGVIRRRREGRNLALVRYYRLDLYVKYALTAAPRRKDNGGFPAWLRCRGLGRVDRRPAARPRRPVAGHPDGRGHRGGQRAVLAAPGRARLGAAPAADGDQ